MVQRLEVFSPRLEIGQECPLKLYSVQFWKTQTRGRHKSVLHPVAINVYTENPMEHAKKLPELISEFINVTGYKV